MTMMSTHYHIKQTMWIGILLSAIATSAADATCERLKATLTYTQEKAPRDLSSVVSLFVCFHRSLFISGVMPIEFCYLTCYFIVRSSRWW